MQLIVSNRNQTSIFIFHRDCYLTPIVPNWLGRQLRLVQHFRRGSQPANLAVQYWKEKSTINFTTSNFKYRTRSRIWTDDTPYIPSQPMCFRNIIQYVGGPTSHTGFPHYDPFRPTTFPHFRPALCIIQINFNSYT